jgi:hypothetical protein
MSVMKSPVSSDLNSRIFGLVGLSVDFMMIRLSLITAYASYEEK